MKFETSFLRIVAFGFSFLCLSAQSHSADRKIAEVGNSQECFISRVGRLYVGGEERKDYEKGFHVEMLAHRSKENLSDANFDGDNQREITISFRIKPSDLGWQLLSMAVLKDLPLKVCFMIQRNASPSVTFMELGINKN